MTHRGLAITAALALSLSTLVPLPTATAAPATQDDGLSLVRVQLPTEAMFDELV